MMAGQPKRPPAPEQKDRTMLNVIQSFKDAAQRRHRYHQIRDEIAGLSRREAIDLGLYPEDAERIAWDAVYGKAA